jgi:hypothetical protein
VEPIVIVFAGNVVSIGGTAVITAGYAVLLTIFTLAT